MRPLLKTGLPRLWRDVDRLQLGADPDRAVLLTGVDSRGLRLLTLLDGTRDVDQLLDAAAAAGVDPPDARAALGVLATAGVLDDAGVPPPPLPAAERDRLAPDLAALSLAGSRPGAGARSLTRRRAARVRVHGAGRVGAPVAALLAASGVGHVDVVDDGTTRPADSAPGGLTPADSGRRRDVATLELIGRAAPSTTASADDSAPASLAVLTGPRAHDLPLRSALMADAVPHLALGVRGLTGVVGPLVLPGDTACLGCLDCHRRDRDPDWPLLAAQLSAGTGTPACDTALAAAVAACAALQVLAHLDHAAPATLGGTLELTPPDHRWRRRSWPPHPDCACAP